MWKPRGKISEKGEMAKEEKTEGKAKQSIAESMLQI
jgi:hypothetical protein